MQKEWVAQLDGRRWSFNKICAEILNKREIYDLDRFLYPIDEDMLPFEDLKNIQQAADTVLNTIKNNGRVLVYADTDCDGLSSGAIITRYLWHFLPDDKVDTYVNDGKVHGVLPQAPCFSKKYDLVIIVDSMQDDKTEYLKLIEMGSKIVVLDHHMIPPCILTMQKKINLVSSMNDYGNPDLCGAGVTLKFCLYLDTLLGTDYAQEYYDLAACGICADMMNVGVESMENRYICTCGFSNLKNKALIKIKGNYEISSTTIAFSIAPLVNAANRMGKNWAALELFLTDDDDEISYYINELKACKDQQNIIVDRVYNQIEEQAREQEDKKMMFFVVEDAENVSGLIANKVLSQYQRPIIITQETVDADTGELQYRGSLRAVGVDDFSKMVNKTRCAKAMGHSNAAGFVVAQTNKDQFVTKIEKQLSNVTFKTEATVDIKLSQKQITRELISWLKMLNRISGQGFPPISVMVEDVEDYAVGYMSAGKHTKITTPHMLFIKWNCNDWEFIDEGKSFSAYGTLDMGPIGKKVYLQMIMSDYKIEDRIDLDDEI